MNLTLYFLHNHKTYSEKCEDKLMLIRAVISLVLATGRKTLMNQSSKVSLSNQSYFAFGGISCIWRSSLDPTLVNIECLVNDING